MPIYSSKLFPEFHTSSLCAFDTKSLQLLWILIYYLLVITEQYSTQKDYLKVLFSHPGSLLHIPSFPVSKKIANTKKHNSRESICSQTELRLLKKNLKNKATKREGVHKLIFTFLLWHCLATQKYVNACAALELPPGSFSPNPSNLFSEQLRTFL